MFDIGFQELVIIFLVALVVFGPKRLPEVGRTLGKWLGELRKGIYDAKMQMESEFEEIRKEQHEEGSEKTVAGETVAGETVAGETVAGETVAGETVAGETVAGEAVAGEAVAGEAVAGEAVAEKQDAGQDGGVAHKEEDGDKK
jgi:Tat protein translocase TatB subunit